MTTITTRSGKGSPLTNDEVDSNFTNLNDDKVEASGDSMTGDLSFGDNNKAIFGAGSDLQILHTGTNSDIRDLGTGALRLIGADIQFLNADFSDFYAKFINNGAAEFYYDGSQKLATTSTGIDVTGTVTADGLTVDGVTALNNTSAGTTVATLSGQYAGSGDVKLLAFQRNGGAVAGAITYADASTGMEIGTTTSHTLALTTGDTQRLRIGNGGDISFYEDTGTVEKFIWDASAERLTLKTSGSFALDVQASGTTSATIAQFSNSAGSDKAYIALDATGAGKLVLLDGGNNEDVLVQAAGHSYYNTGGNFYFGKASGDLSTDGVEARAVGLLGSTRTSNPPLVLRRNTDDGDIITLSKDATEIGSLGSNSGGLFIADDDTGLFFNRASNNILPYRNDSGNEGPYTNALDLGRSTARFKDAYLRSVDITNDSDRGRIRLYANASLGGEMRIFNANGYGLISMIENHTLNFHTNNVERLELGSGVAVFNDISADVDFRVESNNNTHALFVDAGNDRVGVLNSSPAYDFTVGPNGSLGAVSDNFKVPIAIDGGYSTTNSRQHKMIGFIGTSNGPEDVYSTDYTTSGEYVKNFFMGLYADNSYFNNSSFRIVQGAETRLRIDQDGAFIINSSGIDRNTVIRGDTSDNLFVVDAGTNQVLITGDTGNSGTPLRVRNNFNNVAKILQDATSLSNNTFTFEIDSSAQVSNLTSAGAMKVDTFYGNAFEINGMGTTIINEDGAASGDFRVESDLFTHALFVDAGNNRIGFFDGSPDRPVHLKSSGTRNYIKAETTTASISNEAGFDIKTPNTNLLIGALGGGTPYTYFYDLANGYGNLLKLHTAEAGAVFNDDSHNLDFRVESDGNANMLFVDAGNNSVAIGTNSHYDDNTILNVAGGIRTQTGGSTPAGTGDSGFDGFIITGNNQRLNIDVSDVSNGGAYIQSRHNSVNTFPTAYYSVALNPLGGEVNVNDSGSTTGDFRVESANNNHMIFVDASANQVTFGSTSFNSNSVAIDTGRIRLQKTTDWNMESYGDSSSNAHIRFVHSSTQVGAITTSASATTYATSSDSRLKQNITDADDAGELIDAIQVRQFDWIADGEHQRYGMVAQELNTVAPEAVSEGETEEDFMSVDYSKLVPMLVKEIQSLRARVAQLESN